MVECWADALEALSPPPRAQGKMSAWMPNLRIIYENIRSTKIQPTWLVGLLQATRKSQVELSMRYDAGLLRHSGRASLLVQVAIQFYSVPTNNMAQNLCIPIQGDSLAKLPNWPKKTLGKLRTAVILWRQLPCLLLLPPPINCVYWPIFVSGLWIFDDLWGPPVGVRNMMQVLCWPWWDKTS